MPLILLLVAIVAQLVLWIVLIRPNHHSFRLATGLYARIGAAEAGLIERIVLRLHGLNVVLFAFATSLVPVVGPLYAQAVGTDWSRYLPDAQARVVGVVILVAGFLGPMILAVLHSQGLAAAAAITPEPMPAPAPDA